MSTYDLGDGVYLRHEVRDADGTLITATVSLAVTKPSGATVSPAITETSVGVYDADAVIADELGTWTYAWHVSGTITDVAPGYFVIGAQPDRLADPSDLMNLPGIDVDPEVAGMLIECATSVIQAITGQRIVQVVNDVQVFDLDEFDGGPWLTLPEHPVTSVAAVSIGATALSAPVDYTVQASRGRIWRPTGWRSVLIHYYGQPSTVTVTNTHGYPRGHQKLQLGRTAALSLAKGPAVNPGGLSRISIDDYTEAYDAMAGKIEASPFLVDALRKQYRKPPQSVRLVVPR